MPSISGTELRECKQLRDEASAFQAKAEKHRRWGLILANAGEVDLAGEHFSRAETEEHTASMLHHAAPVHARADQKDCAA